MKLKSMLAALALSAASVTGFAGTISWNPDYSIGNFFGNYGPGTSTESFGFTVDLPSYVSASAITISLPPISDFDFTSVTLDGTSFTNLGTVTVGGTEVESWALGQTLINPGTHFLTVSGVSDGLKGGAFSGTINVSPIPEPETYALMLGGLGVVGFLARRRKS